MGVAVRYYQGAERESLFVQNCGRWL